MSLPNFLCVGAQKSGTSTLHEILIQHPDIFLPKIKETHFFDNGEQRYSKGISWYEKEYFSAVKKEIAIGEISTNYMFLDYVPQRIFQDLGPDIKLVFMLRNPTDRAVSQYMMNQRNFWEKDVLETAIAHEKDRIRENESSKKRFSYIERGLYAKQIKRFMEYFPKEQMHFIIFETEFIPNREETMEKLCRFLGISSYDFNLEIQKNVMREPGSLILHRLIHDPGFSWLRKPFKLLVPSQKKRAQLKRKFRIFHGKKVSEKKRTHLDSTIRTTLKDKFRKDIIELENLIGKDLSHWK